MHYSTGTGTLQVVMMLLVTVDPMLWFVKNRLKSSCKLLVQAFETVLYQYHTYRLYHFVWESASSHDCLALISVPFTTRLFSLKDICTV